MMRTCRPAHLTNSRRAVPSVRRNNGSCVALDDGNELYPRQSIGLTRPTPWQQTSFHRYLRSQQMAALAVKSGCFMIRAWPQETESAPGTSAHVPEPSKLGAR